MTFRAVAHARSFSRAAETMSLTQPSVSHQIALPADYDSDYELTGF